MATIIDPTSLSFESIKQDLLDYIASKPEYDSWRDFYESSAGMTAVELVAGIGTFLNYHALGARRESYITTRKLLSSAIGICNTLGYPVNRKSAPRLRLKLNVGTSTYWDRNTAIGTYTNNRNLSILSSQTISAGVVYLDVVVGDWNSTTWTASSTEDFVILKIEYDNIDNNNDNDTIELLINDSPVTLVDHAEDLVGSTVMLRTHHEGVLLIFGDDTLGRRVIVNDEVVLNYVSTEGKLGVYEVDPTDIALDLDAEVQEVEILSPGYEGDSLKKLTILPSGYYTTRRRAVTGLDHVFILEAYVGDLISAGFTKVDGECCTIRLSYLFDDEHIMTNNEVTNVLDYLDDYKMVGEEIEITDPELVGIDMKVTVVVDEGVTEAFVRNEIDTILDTYTWLLNTTFYLGIVVDQISQIEGVNRVYLERPVSDKTLEYQQYLKLVHLDLTVTSDTTTFMTIDPEDLGYVKLVKSNVADGTTTNKLVDSKMIFQITSTTDGTTTDKLVDSLATFKITGTANSTSANKLIDSGATFTSDKVCVGLNVYNTTDSTSAVVVSVDSDTQITLDKDIFVSGEDYAINKVDVGEIVYNTTDSTEALITAVDSATQLSVSEDIFVSGEDYLVGVQVGDVVLNTTDTTRALVTAVDSETQLALDTDIFESGENYAVYTNV